MDHFDLQRSLARMGYYQGKIDGIYGPMERTAVLSALTDGPDYELTGADVLRAGRSMQVEPAKIWAVWDVEAAGDAFVNGRPTILFEPHRFSRATGGEFDKSHPRISSAKWNRKLYPASQDGRYAQLLDAVGLDVDAGFASASYGGFQILGENYAICDAASPWAFAWRQAQTEGDQLDAFCRFVTRNGLLPALRAGDWSAFAAGYNGTAFRQNSYDTKLAQAYARRRAA